MTNVGTTVTPSFKDKARYTLYVKLRGQISHIAADKCNIKRQMLIKHNIIL
jgi:hypothetical protein